MFKVHTKYLHLKEKFGLDFPLGSHSFEVVCEFCGRRLSGAVRISKNNTAWQISLNGGEFHHRDGNTQNNSVENVQILCYTCHKRFHDWGVICRWLKKIGKTVHDLPDASNLPPRIKVRW